MRYAPMLAVASSLAEVRDGYAYEFKWDGVRALVEVGEHGSVALCARSGNDITGRYPELHAVGAAVGRPAVLDGEVIALGDDGAPSFERLQARMHLQDPARVALAATSTPVALVLFDVLELDGRPLVDEPYEHRREMLADLDLSGSRWQTPRHHLRDPDLVLATAASHGLEGLVAKRLGSRYRPGQRSPDWRKVRLVHRQEFVVGGYVRGRGGRSSTFGSLLIGYHDADGRLRYAGRVGSGFSDRALRDLQERLDTLVRPESPFADEVPADDTVFVEPEPVVEVQFTHWTRQGILRAPSFKGLRDDKDPRAVVYRPGAPDGPPT